MRRPLAAVVLLAATLPVAVAAGAPSVRAVTLPRTAVVGSAWQVTPAR
jgi:hypothetical protein